MANLLEIIKMASIEAVNASHPTSLVIGEVTNVKPLEISVEQRLILNEDFLILTKNVKDHYVDMTVNHSTNLDSYMSGKHTHPYSFTDSKGGTYSGQTGETKDLNVKHRHGYEGKKRILLHYGLKKGEGVWLIKVQGGQRYIVLDRIGEVDVEGEWRV